MFLFSLKRQLYEVGVDCVASPMPGSTTATTAATTLLALLSLYLWPGKPFSLYVSFKKIIFMASSRAIPQATAPSRVPPELWRIFHLHLAKSGLVESVYTVVVESETFSPIMWPLG